MFIDEALVHNYCAAMISDIVLPHCEMLTGILLSQILSLPAEILHVVVSQNPKFSTLHDLEVLGILLHSSLS